VGNYGCGSNREHMNLKMEVFYEWVSGMTNSSENQFGSDCDLARAEK